VLATIGTATRNWHQREADLAGTELLARDHRHDNAGAAPSFPHVPPVVQGTRAARMPRTSSLSAYRA